MKLTMQLRQDFNDEDLDYVRQLGVKNVTVGTTGGDLEFFRDAKARVEGAGLQLTNIGNTEVHNMPAVTLGLPERDEKIAEYIQYLNNLAAIGLTYTTYAHMANGIWQSPEGGTARGGARARTFVPDTAAGKWLTDEYSREPPDGRVYTEDEIWANFDYFIRRVVPEAERLGIRIGMHPDDPPGLTLGGVPRCVASSWDGYQRAFRIADSPNFGACLCLGTWLEGGDTMGRDPESAIRGFAERGKLWKVHSRNVTAPLPNFTETFLDAGYGNMRLYLRTLKEVGFDGILIVDHVPGMVGDDRNPWSLSIGYVEGLMDEMEIER